jgi:membrane associated rhomboid family serine protease
VPRSPYATSGYSIRFGPGPLSRAVKQLLIANVVVFLLTAIVPEIVRWFGLTPAAVFGAGWLWQPLTYMFVHEGVFHILFNMLMLWMFGVDLERTWGTTFFTRYYFICGLGAAAAMLLVSLLPIRAGDLFYTATTVGASGALYGLLVAYGLLFPDRPILLLIFPVAARYAVMILAAIQLYFTVTAFDAGVAYLAHLGGLVTGYFYLKRGRGGPLAEIKYRYLKWKMGRLRKKFDVHPGGRGRFH